MISKNIIGQLVALSIVSGAASAALPPVVDGNVRGQVAGAGSVASSSMIGMYNRLEQLQLEVQQMRGQLEEQSYLIETLKKRQRDLYLDTDRRIVQLESGTASSPMVEQSSPSLIQGVSTPTSQPVMSRTTESNGQDKLAYDKAFSSLKSGQFQQSMTDFSAFVSAFPNSAYVPNALYWLGEASYVNRDFKRAVTEFNKVISQYPSHSKAKDAMLKLGFIQYENKQWKQARETLEKVTATYPGTTVASLAKKRLERLSQEKH